MEFVFHLDVQKILETDQTADLDNLVKTGLDALAGPSGMFFDDSQVQCIQSYWLDSQTDWFEITITGSPDEFVIKPQIFYEMPDGLYYPQGPRSWTNEGVVKTEPIFIWTILTQWEYMISQKQKLRHKIRQDGYDKLKAYHYSYLVAPIQRGYHKSRVIEFECFKRKEWQSERLAWVDANPTATPSVALDFIKAAI